MKTKTLLLPMLLIVLAAALMTATMFLPFAQMHSDRSDPLTASLTELAKEAGSFNQILVYLTLGFSLLTAFFALLKLPVVTIVFDALSFGAFLLQKVDYQMRGIVPNERVEYGAAHSLFLIAAVILLAGAVWMIVAKAKAKKAATQV